MRVGLALVQDLREHRVPTSAEELAAFETVTLARIHAGTCPAGLVDSTVRGDIGQLKLPIASADL